MQLMKFSRLFLGDARGDTCVDGLMKKYSVYKRASGVCGLTP